MILNVVKNKKVPITVCQNESWSHNKTINYSDKEIIKRYLHNPLISNICIAGLEPFEQTEEVLQLIKEFRKYTADTIIIYTGFIKEEVKKETTELCQYSNIIIKFGRYILNAEQRFDSILGITLASNNQYAEKNFIRLFKMIKYYKDFSLSLTEINNKPTLSVYSLEKCNLNCFECLNKPILQNKENYKTIEDIINYIDNNDNLFEYIVFSGNEFLTASLEDLGNDLLKIRQITDKHIVIYTNGTFPSKMKRIYATSLVDGFHTDIKLPWHLITMKDKELMLMTVGKFLFDYEIEDIKKV